MKIIGGPSSQLLASRVASALGCELAVCEFKRFPDQEMYIRIMDDIGPEAVIIQSTATDSDYVALLQLIDACSTAERVQVVIPYMGYARQDKVFNRGEALSARAMARTIEAENVITVNIHETSVLEHFRCTTMNIDAAPLMGQYIRDMDHFRDPVVLAPDAGAKGLAASAAEELGIDYDHLEKKRLSGDTVRVAPKNLDVKDRDVVILDDIVSTGGTMAEAVRMLRQQGAADVYVACIHPVLAGSAILKLYRSGVVDVISTDTIEKAVSRVSVAQLIAKTINEL
ncbi:MAG: ribose-phosphate diphosphokinase [ANME-2 cluster archaeon]|nr:ribose-phosphate diphosphokinase [ANME-2 cluster archaeon]